MNHVSLLFLGIFFSLATSWFGMLFIPQMQIGRQVPAESMDGGAIYPQARAGLAQQGAEVYRALGCVTCHSQLVRPADGDIPRFGPRGSVAADYLHDRPAQVGTVRIGPDLANLGLRRSDAAWLLRHLYNPRIDEPKSTMPPYPFLFERRSVSGDRSASNELGLTGSWVPEAGIEIVPREPARALVAYLMSLKSDVYLFERPAPYPPKRAKVVAVSTNAPAGTNAPAQ